MAKLRHSSGNGLRRVGAWEMPRWGALGLSFCQGPRWALPWGEELSLPGAQGRELLRALVEVKGRWPRSPPPQPLWSWVVWGIPLPVHSLDLPWLMGLLGRAINPLMPVRLSLGTSPHPQIILLP